MTTQDAEFCRDCAGSGDIEDSICSNCKGRGEIDFADLVNEDDPYKYWKENADD